MRVKICGITGVDDATLAADLGAWAVGVIFHPDSPRQCDVETAVSIGAMLKRRVEVVGVFVNEPLSRVVTLAEDCELTVLQFHGDEGPAYCAEAARRTGARVAKATRVKGPSSLLALEPYTVDFYLLDSHVPGLRGGSGETFNWSLVRNRRLKAPVILSGGLTPDNVDQAIHEVQPYAVDVASGVEAKPGRKDPGKLRAFFNAVRSTGSAGDSSRASGESAPKGQGG